MKDFVFLNVRDLMARKFWRTEGEHEMVPDVDAAARNRARIQTQLSFMFDNGLLELARPSTEEDLLSMSIKFSDLSDIGRRFVLAKTFEKWFRRLDQNPSKYSVSDSSFLRSELAKILKADAAR